MNALPLYTFGILADPHIKRGGLPEGFIGRVYPDKVLFTGLNLLTGETVAEFRVSHTPAVNMP